MVPAITEGGKSFKGAALYYLHDKRQEGEAVRFTGGRVAWTEVLNLATDDAERAWRRMAQTAMAQAALKQAAGEKATGRKLTKPVLAYSLAWHPGEKPDKAEQLAAARETLNILGLAEHQAIIVCHNDEPHTHVHILVNRVHPETGKAATLSNSKLKLSEWAQKYEQERGQVLCPARVENNARRKRGEFVRSPRVPRAAHEFNRATGNDNLAAEFLKTEERQKDAQLSAQGRQMRAAHARQWEGLKQTNEALRVRMKAGTARAKERRAVEIKEAAKPRWRELFRRQKEQRATFDAAERGILSKLWSMAFVYREMKRQNRDAEALEIFCTLLSSAQRRAVFDAAQERERRDLARRIRGEIGAATRLIGADARKDEDRLREQYLGQCARLRETQGAQQAEYKAAWQVRKAEREQALAPIRERAARMQQARHYRRGRSIKDDDRFGRRKTRPPGPGNDFSP